jgi:hypothetical protein
MSTVALPTRCSTSLGCSAPDEVSQITKLS